MDEFQCLLKIFGYLQMGRRGDSSFLSSSCFGFLKWVSHGSLHEMPRRGMMEEHKGRWLISLLDHCGPKIVHLPMTTWRMRCPWVLQWMHFTSIYVLFLEKFLIFCGFKIFSRFCARNLAAGKWLPWYWLAIFLWVSRFQFYKGELKHPHIITGKAGILE